MDTIINIIGIGSGVSALLFTIAIVGWILSVILFFKIWGMTNNVKRLADKFAPEQQEPDTDKEETALDDDAQPISITKDGGLNL